MFSHNLKIAFRNLWKYRLNSSLNLVGLSLGIACGLAIFLFVFHEKTYDREQPDAERIYRVVNKSVYADGEEHNSGVTPYPLPSAMRADFPDLEIGGTNYSGTGVLSLENEQKFKVEDVLFADVEMAKLFNFNTQTGNLENTLSQPNQAALTESEAIKLFGGNNPIGQRITLDNELNLEVTAIIADRPSNTNLPASILVSYASLTKEYLEMPLDRWGFSSGGCTFVKLPAHISVASVEKRFPAFIEKHLKDEVSEGGEYYLLQPLSEIHFEPQYDGYAETIAPFYINILSWVAVFILFMAAINFTNLSTAFAMRRAPEVGLRKVVGAERGQLISQFLGEAAILVGSAIIIAILLLELTLPILHSLFQVPLSISILPASIKLVLFGGMFLLVTILSGLYPAMMISGFQPLKVLNGRTMSGQNSTAWLRQGLVVVQFTVAISLVIALTLLNGQMDFFKNKSLGFDKETVLTITTPAQKGQRALQNGLAEMPEVKFTSFALNQPMGNDKLSISMPKKIGGTEKLLTEVIPADANYQAVFDLKMAAGRWFTWQDTTLIYGDMEWSERQFRYVINETLAHQLGYANAEDILGEKIEIGINDIQAPVIGVVKDFHTNSLQKEIGPVAFLNFPPFYERANIKLGENTIGTAVPKIEKLFSEIYPAAIFEFSFVDESIAKLYEQESRIFSLFKIFAGIAFVICGLGLWGLITFLAEQKTKEIGIRKVLGASVQSIVVLLSKDFLKLVFFSLLIASPLAYYSMNNWLENFAYRIDIELWVFILAGVAAIFVTLFTVSFQSIRAALANPVESLRSE